MKIKSPPPTFVTKLPFRATNFLNGSALSKNNPIKINGSPSPKQYAAERIAPRCAVALSKAST